MKERESEAYGILGLTPNEFGQLTFGEYRAKIKGYHQKQLNNAFYIALAFNDPKKLNEINMLTEALETRGD
jgi:hypothetical protein